MEEALELLTGLPPVLIYVVLASGAAVENILPVVPADTVILFGGFIAGLGIVAPVPVFLVVWAFNVGAAVGVYALGRRYGRAFFRSGRGRRLMSERRMRRMEAFYRRWGIAAIFLARFLPGFRALVPVFAGVADLGVARVVAPLLAASAIWYGALVRLGYLAGDNIDAVADTLARTNQWLLGASVAVALILAAIWRRRREDNGGR